MIQVHVSIDRETRTYGLLPNTPMAVLIDMVGVEFTNDWHVRINGDTVFDNQHPNRRALLGLHLQDGMQITITTQPDPSIPVPMRVAVFATGNVLNLPLHRVLKRMHTLPDTFGHEPIDEQDTSCQDGITLVIGGGLPNASQTGGESRCVVLSLDRIVGIVAEGPNLNQRIEAWENDVVRAYHALDGAEARIDDIIIRTIEQTDRMDQVAGLQRARSNEQIYVEEVEQVQATRRGLADRINTLLEHMNGREQRAPNEEAVRTIESLMAMPKVLDAWIDNNNVVLRTSRLTCRNSRTQELHEIGAFEIQISCARLEEARVRWRNLTRLINGREHPHINEGYACEGNLTEMLRPLLVARNVPALAAMAIQFIESANMSDPWGRTLTCWPIAGTDAAFTSVGRGVEEVEDEPDDEDRDQDEDRDHDDDLNDDF